MASAACLSKYHFIRLFHALAGVTPYRYLQQKRVAAAQRLLSTTRLTHVEIAEQVGFDHRSTMFRQIRRLTGRSGRQWRGQSSESDIQRLIGAHRDVRCDAEAFQPRACDRVVVGNRHPQMEAAGNVEQLRRQHCAGRFLADDLCAADRFEGVRGDFRCAERAGAGEHEDGTREVRWQRIDAVARQGARQYIGLESSHGISSPRLGGREVCGTGRRAMVDVPRADDENAGVDRLVDQVPDQRHDRKSAAVIASQVDDQLRGLARDDLGCRPRR